MTKSSYYVIRVKDQTGDTVKHISDYEPDFTEDGWMEIVTSTQTIRYNPERVIMFSIEEKQDNDLEKIREEVKTVINVK